MTSELRPGSAPITAIVVTYNEATRLAACLRSLAFCEQVLVVDLGSDDDSPQIARACGAQVITHPRVEVVEQVRAHAAKLARHDWVLYIDPDEEIPPLLAHQLLAAIQDNPNVGIVDAPRQFYFRGQALTCCIWGRPDESKQILFHHQRVAIEPYVHRGYRILEGYDIVRIARAGENYIRHYWIDSYHQLFEKHRRYLKHEGESRYQAGQRFTWGRLVAYTLGAIKVNLIDYRGLWGGFTGIFLSFFHSWYILRCWLALRAYQRTLDAGTAGDARPGQVEE